MEIVIMVNVLIMIFGQYIYGFGFVLMAGNNLGIYVDFNMIVIDIDGSIDGFIYVKGIMGDVEIFDCECL